MQPNAAHGVLIPCQVFWDKQKRTTGTSNDKNGSNFGLWKNRNPKTKAQTYRE